jgi:hypothetical protein
MAEEGGQRMANPPSRGEHGDPSRRSVLRGAAGLAGAGLAATAVAGAATVAPAMAAAAVQPRGQAPRRESAVEEPVVVHLKDAGSGDMEVFAGTRQARLRDPELAARLLQAIR